jgi:hypothetical protein
MTDKGWCAGKVGYNSPQQAHRQLNKRRSNRGGYGKAHVYKCPACAKYHIGHKESY